MSVRGSSCDNCHCFFQTVGRFVFICPQRDTHRSQMGTEVDTVYVLPSPGEFLQLNTENCDNKRCNISDCHMWRSVCRLT